MSQPIQIRMGGYGPPATSFSRALTFIGERLEAALGDRVEVKYVWNIMDLGYRGEEILWLVESGVLTLGYQSTSYLTDRIPELGFADLPFVFATTGQARAYAIERFQGHLDRFNDLADRLQAGEESEALALAETLWERDKVFPTLDYRWFAARQGRAG